MITYLRTLEACSSSYDGAAPVISVAESSLFDALTTATSSEILPHRPIHTNHGNIPAWTFRPPTFLQTSPPGYVLLSPGTATTCTASAKHSAQPHTRRWSVANRNRPHRPALTRASWVP